MIKYSEIEPTFASAGMTVYEYHIETDEDINLPYLVYTITNEDAFQADGINYIKIVNVSLAIIDETMNFALQRKVEDVLDSYCSGYDKQINYDSEARLYSISYSFSVFDDEEERDHHISG